MLMKMWVYRKKYYTAYRNKSYLVKLTTAYATFRNSKEIFIGPYGDIYDGGKLKAP